MSLLAVFNFMRHWSAYVWTVTCFAGIGVTSDLWRRTHLNRLRLSRILDDSVEGNVRSTLHEFERFTFWATVWLLALVGIGIVSMLSPFIPVLPGALTTSLIVRGLCVQSVLLLNPAVITWLIYKAFRIYEG